MSQIQDVKNATDIVQIIGEKLNLQKSGKNFKTTCPFHSEKTPSFFVSQELQHYKCFGCGASGDVFTFLEKYDGLTFSEALRQLADKAGIQLETHHFSKEDDKRKTYLEILNLASEYYHYILTKLPAGKQAQDYLQNRNTHKQTIQLFKLGYSLNRWDGLINYLVKKKKYDIQDVAATGLIIESNRSKGYYDRFRGRIMFPLTDHMGRVVGFSGRVLDPNAKQAKYINTPETSLYHKSELLYGYSQLYRSISEKNKVFICEGEFDVLSSYQAGVKNVVAIKGSALTIEHLQRLSRTVDTVIFALDADDAGVEATRRAIEIAQSIDIHMRVVQIRGGKDVDDIAREDSKKWRDMSKKTISVYEFLIQVALSKHDSNTGIGKRKIIKELAEPIMNIDHAVEQSHYIKMIANKLNVQEELVLKDLKKESLQSQRNKGSIRESGKNTPSPPPLSMYEKLERYAIALLFRIENFPLEKTFLPKMRDLIQTLSLKKILQKAENWHKPLVSDKHDNASELQRFTQSLPVELQQLFSDIYLQQQVEELSSDKVKKELQNTLVRLQELYTKQKTQELTNELEQLDAKKKKSKEDEQRQEELLREIVELRRKG